MAGSFSIVVTAMTTNMKRAVELAFGKSDFLKTSQAYGWFLDDLVPEPINQLKSNRERMAKCLEAQAGLAARIRTYQPQAIVSLLKSIELIVNAAAKLAGSAAPTYGLSFPGQGHQPRSSTSFQDWACQIRYRRCADGRRASDLLPGGVATILLGTAGWTRTTDLLIHSKY
jgi:hypothetical protein